jgi:type III secretory pathway component EscS
MDQYTAPVRNPIRWLAVIGLGLASPLFAAIVAIMVGVLLNEKKLQPDDVAKLVGIITLMSFLCFASGWMCVRIFRGQQSRNGVTLMPTWFLQVCGGLMVVGGIWMTWLGGAPMKLIAGWVFLGVGMLFLPVYLPKPVTSDEPDPELWESR